MSDRELFEQALKALETNNQAWKHLADSGDAGFLEAEEQPFYETSVKAITALRAALAEPVQEPVAWRYVPSDVWGDPIVTQDPKTVELARQYGRLIEPLYTTPPQRKPLTREEAIALWADKSDGPSNGEIVSFARAIERAHGIGGNDE